MSNRSIYVDTSVLDQASELLGYFPKSNSRKIMNRVLKRVVSTVKTETARQMSTVFAISPAQIKSALSNSKGSKRLLSSTSNEGEVSISVVGHPLTATRFTYSPKSIPKPKAGAKRKPYQTTLTVYHKIGSKTLKPVRGADGKLKPVFIAPIKHKEKGAKKYLLYRRTGERNEKGREKLRVIRSVSIPQAILNRQIAEAISTRIGQVAIERLEHEVTFELHEMWKKKNK